MSNDIFNVIESSNLNQQDEFADLDALFSDLRADEPSLSDSNFTKVVVNSLPSKPKRRQARPFAFDLIGLLLGVLSAYWFFDLGAFAARAIELVPESVTLTGLNALVMFTLPIGVAWLGWWAAEKGID